MISEQIMLTGLLVFFTGRVIQSGLKTKLQPGVETAVTGASLVGFVAFLVVAMIRIWSS